MPTDRDPSTPLPSDDVRDLDGRAILVTGGTSGIGEATCRLLAKAGAKVIVHTHDEMREAEDIATQIGGMSLAGDVSDDADVVRLFDEAVTAHGPLYGLVCLAGTESNEPLHELTADGIDRVTGVNLRGTLLCAREGARRLSEGGRIVLTSSVVSDKPNPMDPVFGATKLATEQIAMSAAAALRDRGITVNAIRPGGIGGDDTRLDRAPDFVREGMGDLIGHPIEIARVVRFLLSDAAARITGQSILIDGGLSLGMPGNGS